MSSINQLRHNIKSNPKFFYILGAFKGDGYYNKKDSIVQINVIDIEFLEEIKKTFNELSPETRIKIANHTLAHHNSKAQHRINLNCKAFFDRNYHLLEPKNKNEKIEYLKGLFDAEGSVGYQYKKEKDGYTKFKRIIQLAQSNINDLIKWMRWLNEIGIMSRLIRRNDGRSYFYIKRTSDIRKFAEIINFKIKRKFNKLKFILGKLTKSRVSKIIIKEIIESYNNGLSSLEIAKKYNLSKCGVLYILRKNNIKRRSRLWKDKNIIFSKIISIKSIGKQKGFDLETPKYHNFFLSNGILSHNSTFTYKFLTPLKIPIPFSPKRDMVYTREDTIRHLASKKGGAVFSDEMINVAYNRDFYQEDQKVLIKALNMYRDSCNIFIGCIPKFVELDTQLQKLCKIRITILRRGIALIQTQIPSIYTYDGWDIKNNQKIENKWSLKGTKNPRYGQLTTVRGIIKFGDITPQQREEYEAIKEERRGRIFKGYNDDEMLTDPEKLFYIRLMKQIKAGKLTPQSFDSIINISGKNLATVRKKINAILKDEGDIKRWKDYVISDKIKQKRDKLGFHIQPTKEIVTQEERKEIEDIGQTTQPNKEVFDFKT